MQTGKDKEEEEQGEERISRAREKKEKMKGGA